MTQLSRSLKVLLAVAALTAASGCETLNSLNPFGGSDEDVGPSVKKHDDRPITQKTGEIPADRANSSYSDEDLKAEPQQ